MRPKILLLDEPCDKARLILEEVFETVKPCEDLRVNLDRNCVGLYVGLTRITNSNAHLIMPTTKFIACPCTGIEHLNMIPAKYFNFKIIHLDEEWRSGEGRKITSTAEHTWSLILQLAKLKRMQISGKTIGIVGSMGRIGKQIIQYANAFGMKHIGCDLNAGYKLDIILEDSDIITLHVPLDAKTKGMIGKRELDLMKPNTLLINTSRAEIVDEDALVEALCNNKIGGYADDFKDSRRQINNYYLRGCSNVIQTPHIGGNCIEAREATDIYIAKKAVEYWRSRNP